MVQRFVAYYRVSTDKQGERGLGMDAQRAAVARYAGAFGGEMLAEFVEVESGRRVDRPQLLLALDRTKRERATLLIAKLDRLARNVAFISRLLESGVDLVCCDMPQANKLTIHILAAVAEHEREIISERTKAALAVAKARGVRLGARGGYDPAPARIEAIRLAAKFRSEAAPDILRLARDGLSLHQIASELNRLRVRAYRGGDWHPGTVWRILRSHAKGDLAIS